MGNQQSHVIQGDPVNVKQQNGGPNGHVVTISATDAVVACETAVQANSELPSSTAVKEPSPQTGDAVDGGTLAGKPVVLLSFTKTTPPSADAPKDPSKQPDGTKASAEEDAGKQSLKPAQDTPAEPDPAPKEEEPKQNKEKIGFFAKAFKKKNKEKIEKEPAVVQCDGPPEDQKPTAEVPVVLTNGLHSEPADIEETPAPEKVPEGPAPNGTPVGSSALGVDGDSAHPADTEEGERAEEESSVMNFFKTLVTPSKTPKQEGAPPAAPADEAKGSGEPEEVAKAETSPVAQPAGAAPAEPKAPDPPVKESGGSPFSKLFRSKPKDAKPASTAKVAQEVDATAPKPPPPPPPPEPPKLEGRAEGAAKIANSTPKDAAKETEAAAKQKASKGSPFSKLFHAKKEEEEEVAKVEEPQPASQEEEVAEVGLRGTDAPVAPGQSPKPEKKSGKASLASLFKPKSVPKDENQTEADGETSSSTTADTKAKEGPSPAVTVVTVETTQSVQVKAEPKPVAEVERKRQEGPAADGKSVSEASQTGEDSGRSFTKRLEKRNSIHAFFKNLGPKRQSDVGVQTDPVTITYPAK